MKRRGWLLLTVLMTTATMSAAAVAVTQSQAQLKAGGTFPGYPLWLAKLLAPLGVAGAQALAGFQALAYDPCKGGNWLLDAARQHHLFGEWQLIGYYIGENEHDQRVEHLEKALLWHLHWQTHFPHDDDLIPVIVGMLKLTPEQESAVREKFKTWDPADEPPNQPASCPSDRYAPN